MVSRACVQQEDLCDYADNCGDLSDEVGEMCMDYTRIDFEVSGSEYNLITFILPGHRKSIRSFPAA